MKRPALATILASTRIKDILPRFWSHVVLDECRLELPALTTTGSGCWLWRGMRSSEGYGHLKLQGRRLTAHRLSWIVAHGSPEDLLSDVDPGQWFLCHTCDNKNCVNPAHLFLGTQSDNTVDCVNKRRHANTRKITCVRGHPLTGPTANVYLYKGSRRCRYCKQIRKRLKAAR
jgi:hypothetical protein